MNFTIDLRYAFRLLLNKPGFSALTIAVMACGLGLCIYMYSFLYAIMFKPLPFENGERMVMVDKQVDGVLHNGAQVKFDYYQDVKRQTTSFELFSAMAQYTLTISGGDNAANYLGVYSHSDIFEFTQVKPIMGRAFNQADDTPGASAVALIGYDLWQGYFAGREDILGHQFYVEGEKTEVIGVMPKDFLFPRANQLWLPIKLQPQKYQRGSGPSLQVYGLLKQGVDIDQANQEMAQIIDQTNREYPEYNTGEQLVAITFMHSAMGNGIMPIVIMKLVAVTLVLLLACVNVANLLYARSTERAKETAIRVALGAPQSRLILQMMWESLIICTIGGTFALLMAAYGLEVTSRILPSFLSGRAPFWWHIQIDGSQVLFTVVLTLVTAFITGILPALKIINGDFNAILRDGTRGAISRNAKKAAQLLVIFEVTLSVGLLTAAVVMTKAAQSAVETDYGAKTSQMLTAEVSLPQSSYDQPEQRLSYYNKLLAELNNIAGVQGVGLTTALPAQNGRYRAVMPEGFELTNDNRAPMAVAVDVMPGTMEMMHYKRLKGRFFTASDNSQSEAVVIVTQSFADKAWPSQQNILGKRLKWAGNNDDKWYRVVGVIDNVIHGQPFADFKYRPSVYRSFLQTAPYYGRVALATDGDPNQLRQALVSAFDHVDGLVPAYRIKTIEQVLERNTAAIGFVIKLFMLFGIIATVLAASGIYALMSQTIGQRTQELGVRRALGATDDNVIHMLLKQGLVQLLIGTLVGLPLAYLFGTSIMALIGVDDWQIYAVFAYVPLFIAAVVILATYLPARKAVAVEPNVALRYE